MQKDFENWNMEKIETDSDSSRLFFHEREVWWCKLGVNIGFEQDGKGDSFGRPVLVFKKFNNDIFWALPISTKIKKSKFYESLILKDKKERVAILSQLRLVDAKRLVDKIETISMSDYVKIQKAVIRLCDE